jgi:hypothetical protein
MRGRRGLESGTRLPPQLASRPPVAAGTACLPCAGCRRRRTGSPYERAVRPSPSGEMPYAQASTAASGNPRTRSGEDAATPAEESTRMGRVKIGAHAWHRHGLFPAPGEIWSDIGVSGSSITTAPISSNTRMEGAPFSGTAIMMRGLPGAVIEMDHGVLRPVGADKHGCPPNSAHSRPDCRTRAWRPRCYPIRWIGRWPCYGRRALRRSSASTGGCTSRCSPQQGRRSESLLLHEAHAGDPGRGGGGNAGECGGSSRRKGARSARRRLADFDAEQAARCHSKVAPEGIRSEIPTPRERSVMRSIILLVIFQVSPVPMARAV